MAKIHKYTKEQKEFIVKNHKGCSYKKMSELLFEKFETRLSNSQIKSFYGKNKLNSGLTGRFEKGQVPFNKGLKQSDYMSHEAIEKTKPTRFQKGQPLVNHREVGSKRMTRDGYVEIKIAEPDVWKLKHRIIWEKANGPVSKSHRLIFLNWDRKDTRLENLEQVSYAISAIMSKFGLFKLDADLTKTGILIAKVIKSTNRNKLGHVVKSVEKEEYGYLINGEFKIIMPQGSVEANREIPKYIFRMRDKLLNLEKEI